MERNLSRRFGVRMQQWRKQEKLTARQMGKKIGASDTYVLNLEKGFKPPTDSYSAIGQALYALVGDQPTMQERFLWTQWFANERSVQQLGFAILAHYASFDPSRTLANIPLPPLIDPSELLQVFGGGEAGFDEAHERIGDIIGGTWVDWILQTTCQLEYEFPPLHDDALKNANSPDPSHASSVADAPRIIATLRYPSNSANNRVQVPYSL